MDKMVSVIIPLYNGELFIERCVNSLVKQTYQKIEIIIINDGSLDNSGKISDRLSLRDSRISVIHQVNKGVSFARNKGLKAAKGELIVFCDADDYVHEQYIEKLVEASEDADFVACGYLRTKPDQTSIEYVLNEVTSKETFSYHMLCTPYITGACWNKIFKKSILEDDCFDETLSIGEDMLFVATYLKKCKTVKYIGEALYVYCLNINSALQNNYTKKKLNKNVESNIEAAFKIERVLRGESVAIDSYLAYRIVRSNLWVMFQMISCSEYKKDLGVRIRNNLRRFYKEYVSVKQGGLFQKIAVILTAISPKVIYVLGTIVNRIRPQIFSKQLV